MEAKRQRGLRHLHTSLDFYKKQIDEGRYFLHEHPDSATSWQDEKLKDLQQLPGVFTVKGPMCFWDMYFDIPGKEAGYICKPTRWMTNSRILAEILDQRCVNYTGGPFH